MEKTKEIKKLLKQYGAVMTTPEGGFMVEIAPPGTWKEEREKISIQTSLEKAIKIMQKDKRYGFYLPSYDDPLPAVLYDYLVNDTGLNECQLDTLRK